MIEYIAGVVKLFDEGLLIVEVGPIGIALQVPTSTTYEPRQEAVVYTYLHWNQETGPHLYGFASSRERRIFLLITSCSGVGPRLGIAILSDLGVDRFLVAVQMEDVRALSSVSGIGAKKAEQIIVHLKHKVAQLIKSGEMVQGALSTQWHEMAQVLESLKYTKVEVGQALQHVRVQYAQKDAPFDALMRCALSFLAKKS